MLMSGTRMTVPVTCAGSRAAMSFSMAMMETYSVPCAPETSARTLPGLAPFTTTMGMLVDASTPAGTSRAPADFSPGAAGGGAAGGFVFAAKGGKKKHNGKNGAQNEYHE